MDLWTTLTTDELYDIAGGLNPSVASELLKIIIAK
jgi:hypothetical protein